MSDVTIPDAAIEITVHLDDEEREMATHDVEILWATTPITDESGRLENIPMFAQGLARFDVLKWKRERGSVPFFMEVIEESGHSVAWVLDDADDPDAAHFRDLRGIGCSVDRIELNVRQYAIDIPREADFRRVCAVLRGADEAGALVAFAVLAREHHETVSEDDLAFAEVFVER